MLRRLARAVLRRVRPRLINHSLTDAPVVRALRRAADREALVAVYDDGTAAGATAETLARELDATLPADRELRLPSVADRGFAGAERPVRARTLLDAEPPVILLSRRSLRGWGEPVRDFVIAHEFGHLCAERPPTDTVVESLLPAPDRSSLALRWLVMAHAEYRTGEAHAAIRAALPESHRTPTATMAEYHAAERALTGGPLLSPAERRALAIRNAAKYLPLPYEPPEIGSSVRTALHRPLPKYLDWVIEGPEPLETSA